MIEEQTNTRSTTVTQAEARVALNRFIENVFDKKQGHIPGKRLQREIAALIPANLRNQSRVLATRAIGPYQVRKAKRIIAERKHAVKLHLGSGELPREGWVNVDLIGVPTDVSHDLTQPLPFPNNTADAVFHEHVLEHLPIERGLQLTKECLRVLRPSGVLRICVPDAQKHIGWYFDGTTAEERSTHATPLMSVLQQFYGFGHRIMYDYETLSLLCRAAGFKSVEQRSFRDSRLDPAPDHEWREWDSLYVECVK